MPKWRQRKLDLKFEDKKTILEGRKEVEKISEPKIRIRGKLSKE